MKQISLTLGLTLLMVSGFAQKNRSQRRMTLKVTVVDSANSIQAGYLAAVADSGLMVLESPVVFDQKLASSNLNTIGYHKIQKVTIRKKGSVGRGILAGTFSGFAIGTLVGAVTYRPWTSEWSYFDPGREGQAVAMGFLGAIGGGIVGGIIGAVAKKTWPIGGKKNRYEDMKAKVLDMTYSK